jgi:hypothetical protein
MKSSHLTAVLLALGLGIASCGPAPKQGPLNEDVDPRGGGVTVAGEDTAGRITDIPGLSLQGGGGGGGLTNVNRFLWRASLDTLAFLPLNSTDPFTGVIATDWAASPDAPEERFKVTAYVKGTALAANTLQVAVFREIRDPQGSWATAPVSGVTARQLEDAILLRARQLKIADRQGG